MPPDKQRKWAGHPVTRGQDMGAMHFTRTWSSSKSSSISHNNLNRRQVLPPLFSRWGKPNSDWPKTTLTKWEQKQQQHGDPLIGSPVPHQGSKNATQFQPAGCQKSPSQCLYHYISPTSLQWWQKTPKEKAYCFSYHFISFSMKCKVELHLYVLCAHHDPSTECYNLISNWDGAILALSNCMKGRRPQIQGAKPRKIKTVPLKDLSACPQKKINSNCDKITVHPVQEVSPLHQWRQKPFNCRWCSKSHRWQKAWSTQRLWNAV